MLFDTRPACKVTPLLEVAEKDRQWREYSLAVALESAGREYLVQAARVRAGRDVDTDALTAAGSAVENATELLSLTRVAVARVKDEYRRAARRVASRRAS